jgi:hypothetical protein
VPSIAFYCQHLGFHEEMHPAPAFDRVKGLVDRHPWWRAMANHSRQRSWTAHLWVLMPPVAAVVIGYVFWTLLMTILSLKLPPWLSRLLYGR